MSVELARQSGPLRPVRTVRALEDVSFTAPSGCVTAIVGTNGAGKTTLLRALTGAVPVASGAIEVLGAPVGPASLARPAGVGVVPDAPLLPPDWSADDVVRLHRRLGDPLDVPALGRDLRRHGIDPGAPISRLSAGQATRFSLAVALAQDPALLLLDEPLARMDPLARRELLDDLREHLARSGPTGGGPTEVGATGDGSTEDGPMRSILLSTHDLDGMDRFVDRLVVLHEGLTVLTGDVDRLLEDHLVALMPSADASARSSRGAARSPGTRERLLPLDDAVGLPPGTALREPDLADLVELALAGAKEHS
ncbi:ATP-binding cassette domain-containing protein [Brachybacterium sp. DNPG3]